MIRNGLEPWHLILVFAVILLVFGGKKLPEVARGMGQSLRIFRAEAQAGHKDAEDAEDAKEAKSSDSIERRDGSS